MMRALWLHHHDDAAGGRARRSSSCGAATSSCRRSSRRARLPARLYLPKGTLVRFLDRARRSTAAARSTGPSTSKRCRSTRAPAPSCRSVRLTQLRRRSRRRAVHRHRLPRGERRVCALRRRWRAFDYRRGDWMRIAMTWDDASRTFAVRHRTGCRGMRAASLRLNRCSRRRFAGCSSSRIRQASRSR